MSSEILVAIMGFMGTVFGSCLGAVSSAKLTNYRLSQLEHKLDNCPINAERISLMEQRSEEHEKRITKLEAKIEKA